MPSAVSILASFNFVLIIEIIRIAARITIGFFKSVENMAKIATNIKLLH